MKNEPSNEVYGIIGKSLIKLQILETQIKLFVSLLKPDIKTKYKIKELEHKRIMDNSDDSRKTLGNLMHILKSELPFFKNEDFEKLLKMRNIFVHSFQSEYLNNKKTNYSETKTFLLLLNELTENFAKIFIGLNTLSVKLIAQKKLTDKDYDKMKFHDLEKDEEFFLQFLTNHIK